MKKRERGAVTIEATICLTAFMFAIVVLPSAVDICLAQARIGMAINATAKEISQYSYLYGLTGFNQVKANLKEGGKVSQEKMDNTIKGINDVFNAIQNIGDAGKSTNVTDPASVTATWNSVKENGGKIEASAGDLRAIASSIKDDPKGFIWGIAKLGSSDLLDIGMSKLIAEPIAMAMVQKHLKSYDEQDPEAFLRGLRVVPDATGSCLGGLDFSESSLFMYGSDEIRIVVKYKIRVLPLLGSERLFTFRQVAVTKGWLGGDNIKSKFADDAACDAILEKNESLWTQTDNQIDRGAYIKDRVLTEEKPGFYKLKDKVKYVDAYNPKTNEFLLIFSSNPLYSPDPKNPKKVSDITDSEIRELLDKNVDRMNAELDGIKMVSYSVDGLKEEKKVEAGYKKTIELVIPEDEGLKERIQSYIDSGYDSGGINIVVTTGYGCGASAIEVPKNEEEKTAET